MKNLITKFAFAILIFSAFACSKDSDSSSSSALGGDTNLGIY